MGARTDRGRAYSLPRASQRPAPVANGGEASRWSRRGRAYSLPRASQRPAPVANGGEASRWSRRGRAYRRLGATTRSGHDQLGEPAPQLASLAGAAGASALPPAPVTISWVSQRRSWRPSLVPLAPRRYRRLSGRVAVWQRRRRGFWRGPGRSGGNGGGCRVGWLYGNGGAGGFGGGRGGRAATAAAVGSRPGRHPQAYWVGDRSS